MKKLRILIVEDAPAVLDYLYKTVFEGNFEPFQETLAKNNIQITYAETFEKAEALTREKFDIVFLDHNLPKAGSLTNCGYTLIPEFRKHNKNIFIVGTSSLDGVRAPYDLKFEKSGADNYEKLCEIVEEILKRK